ncbi:MAG: 50S ribosomal protein L23 [Myxococcota bacterium]
MHNEHIIKRPILLTEKAADNREEHNQVTFEVALKANKIQIRSAVEQLFGVTVTSVNTAIMRGKERRMGRGYGKLQNWKKAVVTLSPGDDIQFYEEEDASDDEEGDTTDEE